MFPLLVRHLVKNHGVTPKTTHATCCTCILWTPKTSSSLRTTPLCFIIVSKCSVYAGNSLLGIQYNNLKNYTIKHFTLLSNSASIRGNTYLFWVDLSVLSRGSCIIVCRFDMMLYLLFILLIYLFISSM